MNDYIVSVHNKKYEIKLPANSTAEIDGREVSYELITINHKTFRLKINERLFTISFDKINSEEYSLVINGSHLDLVIRTSLQEKASQLISAGTAAHQKIIIKAPMPGMILRINKKEGDEVRQDESLLILEAMKMENEIKSPKKGIIKRIITSEQEAVERGAPLLEIE